MWDTAPARSLPTFIKAAVDLRFWYSFRLLHTLPIYTLQLNELPRHTCKRYMFNALTITDTTFQCSNQQYLRTYLKQSLVGSTPRMDFIVILVSLPIWSKAL